MAETRGRDNNSERNDGDHVGAGRPDTSNSQNALSSQRLLERRWPQTHRGHHRREWYYVKDLTAEGVAGLLSDLKPKERRDAKVASIPSYDRTAQLVTPLFIVWYPQKG